MYFCLCVFFFAFVFVFVNNKWSWSWCWSSLCLCHGLTSWPVPTVVGLACYIRDNPPLETRWTKPFRLHCIVHMNNTSKNMKSGLIQIWWRGNVRDMLYKIYTILPVQIWKGVRSKQDGVGYVGKNVNKEVFQRVAIVGGQGYWSCPLMVHLGQLQVFWWWCSGWWMTTNIYWRCDNDSEVTLCTCR